MAIATTTSRANVDALFASLLGARLGRRALRPWSAPRMRRPRSPTRRPTGWRCSAWASLPHEAFALEDSPNGLKAARAAGIACGVTRSAYFAGARFDGAAWVRDDLEHRRR